APRSATCRALCQCPIAVRRVPFSLYRDMMFKQAIIKRGFLVCRFLSLTDDQCTGYLVFTRRKFFGIRTRDDDRTCRDEACMFDRFGAGYIDDFGGCGEYNVSTQYGFTLHMNALHHDGA